MICSSQPRSEAGAALIPIVPVRALSEWIVCPRGVTEQSDEGTADQSVWGEGRVKGKQVMKKHPGLFPPLSRKGRFQNPARADAIREGDSRGAEA